MHSYPTHSQNGALFLFRSKRNQNLLVSLLCLILLARDKVKAQSGSVRFPISRVPLHWKANDII